MLISFLSCLSLLNFEERLLSLSFFPFLGKFTCALSCSLTPYPNTLFDAVVFRYLIINLGFSWGKTFQ